MLFGDGDIAPIADIARMPPDLDAPDLEAVVSVDTAAPSDGFETTHSAVSDSGAESALSDSGSWATTGVDVVHPEFGHGWVQGSGHGVVTVRFETRATGPGIARTFAADDGALRRGDPLDSLAWPDVPR